MPRKANTSTNTSEPVVAKDATTASTQKIKFDKLVVRAKLGHDPMTLYLGGHRIDVDEEEHEVSAEFAALLKSEGLID